MSELMKPRKPQRYDLLPWDAIDELATHFGRGAAKYEAREWESKGYPWSDYFNAMQRHAALFWSGEDKDPEDEFLHATAMTWNALALLTFVLRGLPGDDRKALQPPMNQHLVTVEIVDAQGTHIRTVKVADGDRIVITNNQIDQEA